MEKKGLMMPLLVAIGATVIYFMIVASKESQLKKNYEMINVLTAATELPERTVLNERLVEVTPVPRKYVLSDAYEVRSPTDISLISNLVTLIRVPKGNQISQSSLTSLSLDAGLSVKIPPGFRGTVLTVEKDLAQLVKPGDHVDLMVTCDMTLPDGQKEKMTMTVLQAVLVLGVGNNLGPGTDAGKLDKKKQAEADALAEKVALSLALNPSEAQYMALMQRMGDVTVALRALGDIEMHPMPGASLRALFGKS